MRRLASVLIALTVCACAGHRDAQSADAVATATVAMRRGDLAAADASIQRGLELTGNDPEGAPAWRLRLLSADVLLAKRDFKAASAIAGTALPGGTAFQPLVARQKYLRARIAYAQGKLPDATTIANEALNETSDPELKLDIGGFVGQLALQTGRWTEGEASLEQVAAQADAGGHRYIQAMAVTSLGMGKFVRNRCDEALPQFEKVVSLPDIADTTIYARALYNAGMCYTRLGEFDRAIEVQKRAVAASEKRPASDSYEQALGQLGNTYLLQGNTTDGLAHMQRAFKAASDAKLSNDAGLWARNLTKGYIDLQRWEEAERFNEEAKRLTPPGRAIDTVYNTENSASIAAGRQQLDEATRLYTEVIASRDAPPSALWHAHFGLAGVATARRQPAAAAREFEAALRVIEQTRAGLLRVDYKLSYLTQLIAFYRAYVDVLIAQGQTDRALEIADSSRGQVLAERQSAAAPARASVAAFTRLAKESRTVFLSYWLTPAKSYLWVIDGSGANLLPLPPAAEIQALVRDHSAAIANALVNPLAAGDTAGSKLYRLLIQPASRWLQPGASVVIVPDGALSSINFETLPVEGPVRHYWIEDVETQVAPSLASLTRGQTARREPPSLLLIGNPSPRPPAFPALRAAPGEMQNIARHFDASRMTRHEGATASPAAYRDANPGRFAYVHFTAHAVANVESPLDSAVILSGPDNAYKLYARDVAALPLAAELVTVSACRSAGERAYSGEGLVGFSWAFLRAGARRVIAGLWDVDDQTTADLMDRVYAGLAAGDSPARALRNAKLALIRRTGGAAAPYNWAPFELFTVSLP